MNRFYKLFILPLSKDKDESRREFVLNILLVGLTLVAFISFISNCINYITNTIEINQILFPSVTFIFFLFFLILLLLSRKGKPRLASVFFILFLLGAGAYTSFVWGVDVPQALLVFALSIVISGILIDARFSLFVTASIAIYLLLVNIAQTNKLYALSANWRQFPATINDIFVYAATLFVLALVSWIFTHELEEALKRAQKSEKQLEEHNKLLEVKVAERTEELRKTQLEKITQLYRFAELGRLASGILHDMVTPLTAVSLNLSLLDSKSKKINKKEIIADKTLLDRSVTGIRRMEDFIQSVRKQLRKQEVKYAFSLVAEIRQVIDMLSHKAHEAGVAMSFKAEDSIEFYGDPIKFNQVITNIVVNAIEAYDQVPNRGKMHIGKVAIVLTKTPRKVFITITDWGIGIPKENLEKVFEPLFTTKGVEKGTGIGLYISKEMVQNDFGGEISIKSKVGFGTEFKIVLPIKRNIEEPEKT